MRKHVLMAALAAVALLLTAGTSRADTVVVFTSVVGDLGSSSATFGGLINADGYYKSGGGAWLPAHLFGRNQTNDHGIGVCNPWELSNNKCGTGNGQGDWNELSNEHGSELIRLTLPAGYEWVSVRLSSLDNNDSTSPSKWERGELWVDQDGIPSTTIPNIGDQLIWQFNGGGGNPVEPSFLIPAANVTSPYLFFEPYDWRNVSTWCKGTNNDFLVYQATVKPIPEPATLLLVGSGLAGVWLKKRKRAA